MKELFFTCILNSLLTFTTYSQTYIEPFLGYRASISTKQNVNPSTTLQQLYTGIQLSKLKRNNYEYAFQLSIGVPIAKNSFDSSFTLNTNLPLYAPANKEVLAFSASTYFIQKYKLINFKDKDKISLLLNTGLAYRNIKISYNNNKADYVILNPDKTQNVFGVSLGFGLQYTHSFKKKRFFIQGDVDFPLIRKRNENLTSFKTIFPFTIFAGYSIKIQNKKHGK